MRKTTTTKDREKRTADPDPKEHATTTVQPENITPSGIERDFAFLKDSAYYGLNAALQPWSDDIGTIILQVAELTPHDQSHNESGTNPAAIWHKAQGTEVPSTLTREEQLERFVRLYLERVQSIWKHWELRDSPLRDECLVQLVEQLLAWQPQVNVHQPTNLDAAKAAAVELIVGTEALLPKLSAPAAGRLKWKGNKGELAALIRVLVDNDWIAKTGGAALGRKVANLFEGEDGQPFEDASFAKWMQPLETPPSRVDFSEIPKRPVEPTRRKHEAKR